MGRRAKGVLTEAMKEKYREELEEALDLADELRAKKKKLNDAMKGQIQLADKAIYLLRRRLKGEDLEQGEFPGVEVELQPLDRGTESEIADVLDRAKRAGK